jgi:hypothetical protein
MECPRDRIVIERTIGFSPKRQFAGPTFLSFQPFSEGKKDIRFITAAATATWPGNHRERPFAIAAAIAWARQSVWTFARL